ncbi:hypothetical protein H4R19_003186 [Coemansia spiralis]|nr:hypothetical protein H4R19_003186 [Coemansia spiralis]
MPVPLPYAAARLRSKPVAEVCGVVASNAPLRLRPAPVAALPKRPSAGTVRRQQQRHGRSLELLRAVLTTAAVAALEAVAPARSAGDSPGCWTAALADKRAVFVEALRELQHPHAEAIGTIHALLDNRVCLGLLSPAAAGAFGLCSDDDVGLPLSVATTLSIDGSLSSSLESTDSAATFAGPSDDELDDGYDDGEQLSLVDAWASGRRWPGPPRGSSICSEATLAGSCDTARSAPLPDDMGICWPLGGTHSDAACAWGRFYAELGEMRIPTRFRTPQHSLAKLATEQLMMRNDKIVCPLKNRLQEPNPRRLAFEDHIRATGIILPPTVATRHCSPLRSETSRTAAP